MPTPHHSLDVRFPTHDLSSLHSIHLLQVPRRRRDLPDRPHLVSGISRNANIVVPLQYELDITNLKCAVPAQFGQLAG